MSSVTSDLSISSMEKWGIPDTGKEGPESSVLERLVWVQYDGVWWPAILYQSYLELQQYMYTSFCSYVVKAQFALAIMRQMQEKRNVKVARLLGRETLEIIEIEDNNYREFYWHLVDILPEVCDKSNYGGNLDLFIAVHRALDEVETIFREVTNSGISLSLVEDGHRTWLERAQAKLLKQDSVLGRHDRTLLGNDRDDDTVDSIRHFRQTLGYSEGRGDWSNCSRSSTKSFTKFQQVEKPSNGILLPGDKTREEVISARSSFSPRDASFEGQKRMTSADSRAAKSNSREGISRAPRVSPGDETREDLISANSSSSQQQRDPLPSDYTKSSGSDVVEEMIKSLPSPAKSSRNVSIARPREQRREMIPQLLQEIDRLQKAIQNQKGRRRKGHRRKGISLQPEGGEDCLKSSSTISTIPSPILETSAQVSRADAEKVNNIAFPGEVPVEALLTSKGRVIPRRGAGLPRPSYDFSGPPMVNQYSHTNIMKIQQPHFQNNNPSPHTIRDTQSLLMEAKQQRQNPNPGGHDVRSSSEFSSQKCRTFCGYE